MNTTDTGIIDIGAAKAAKAAEYNKDNYGNIIRTKRTELGLTQQQLADTLKLSKNQIAHWEAGRARPDLNLVPALCRTLKITISEFFGTPGCISELPYATQRHLRDYNLLKPSSRAVIDKTIDSILEIESAELQRHCAEDFIRIMVNEQRACAGTFNPLESEQCGEYIYIRADGMTCRADEIIIVSGNSMEPTYYDGDKLLVEHTPELNYGDIGLFVINGEGFVKEYRANGVYSHNSKEYPFRKFRSYDSIQCVGRVIGKLDASYYPDKMELAILEDMRLEEESDKR